MTFFSKVSPWLRRTKHQLIFFSLSMLCVVIENMDFWIQFGIRPFLFLTLMFISTAYSLPFINVLSLLLFGLMQDGYYNYPLGYSSSQLMFLYLILIRQKKSQMLSIFVISWIYFSLFMAFVFVIKVLAGAYIGRFPPSFKNLIGDTLLTISLYPLLIKGVFWLANKIPFSLNEEADER